MTLPIRTVLRGFLLAPLLPIALIFGVGAVLDAIAAQRFSPFEVVGHALFVLVYFTLASYVFMTLFVLPIYLLGWAFLRVNLISSVLCGMIIGGACLLIPFLLQYYGHAPMFDSESLGGTALIVGGKFTAAGIRNRLEGIGESALFGAAVAVIFWTIAIRGNPAAQSRRDAGGGAHAV